MKSQRVPLSIAALQVEGLHARQRAVVLGDDARERRQNENRRELATGHHR